MDNKRPLIAHLCLFCSGAFWGLMAPVGKDAMMHGIDGIDLVSFRVLGGAILFWLTSLFTKKEHVPVKDIFMFAAAGIFRRKKEEPKPVAHAAVVEEDDDGGEAITY